MALRSALLNAKEPSTLVFEQLPAACGLSPVPVRKKSKLEDTQKYVRELKKGLGELRSAYPTLLACIEKSVADEFEVVGQHEALRMTLERKAAAIAIHISEPSLKAFCLRLADSKLTRDAWLESIGSLVLAKPPRRWQDLDVARFKESLHDIVVRFNKTASVAFSKGGSSNGHSLRLEILRASGEETSCVVQIFESKAATSLRLKMERLFDENPSLAIAVASEVLLSRLSNGK
jgi:hypothetical protein